MKCIKCGEDFYIDINENILRCMNNKCKLIIKNPKKLEWKCKYCFKKFCSDIKLFNPLEKIVLDKEIKKTLIIGNQVEEKKCDCNAELFLGIFMNKKIIVCDKCKKVSLYYEHNNKNKNDNHYYNNSEIINNDNISLRCKNKLLSKLNNYTKPKYIFDNNNSTNYKTHIRPNSNIESNINNRLDNYSKNENLTNTIRQNSIRSKYKHLLNLTKKRVNYNILDENNKIKVNISNLLQIKIKVNKNEKMINKKEKELDDKFNNNTDIKNDKELPIVKNSYKFILDKKNRNESNNNKITKRHINFNKYISQYNTLDKQNEDNNIGKKEKLATIFQKRRNINLKINKEKIQSLSVNRLKLKFNSEEEDNNDKDKENLYEIINKEILKKKELIEQIKTKLNQILENIQISSFITEDYKIIKSIGEGTYGTIYEVVHKKLNKRYAMKKIVANNLEKLENFVKGYQIAHSIKHENIVDIIALHIKCVDINKFLLYILIDLAESDWDLSIKNHFKEKSYYTESELISILSQLISALIYLKNNNIVHRDIKPENILIFNNIYKLTDFGEAKITFNLEKCHSLRGTNTYMSPILYNKLKTKEKKVEHDVYKSDIYSLGICFLYASELNFNTIISIRDLNFQGLADKLVKNMMKKRYSEEFIEIILKMIKIDENERIDFLGLKELLVNYYNKKEKII